MHIFRGRTYYDIGRQKGIHFYKKNKFKLRNMTIRESIYKQQLGMYKKYYPELLNEIRGIANETGIDLKKLTYGFICDEMIHQKHSGCSIFNYNGLLGRNYDWSAGIRETSGIYKVVHINEEGKDVSPLHSFIFVSDGYGYDSKFYDKKHSILSGDDYINDVFLYIGYTYAYSTKMSFGLLWSDYMRLMSETCTTIGDVIKFLRKVPNAIPKNIFITDSTGDSIVIEHNSGFDYKIFRPMKLGAGDDTLLIHTNHFLYKMYGKKYDTGGSNGFSERRYNAIYNLCKELKPKSLIDIKLILDDDLVYDLYRHKPETIWQLMLDLKHKKIYCFIHGKLRKLDLLLP